MRSAIFPGSFDPITKGHEDLVLRALSLFDKIYVALGTNPDKQTFFPVEKRVQWLREVFKEQPNIEVVLYEGLTVDLCKKLNSNYILRGLRTSADFEFERSIGLMNKKMHPEIESLFLLTSPEYTALSSSIVREIYRNGGDPRQFLPAAVII